jgi:hypothetical protein
VRKAAEVLKNTAGFVVSLRNVFLHQFEAFEKGAKMGAHSKDPVRPKFVGFSDSFVSSVPLRDDGAYVLESEVAQYPRIVIGDEFWK